MLDYVRNNWNSETVRTNLEAQMAYFQSEISVNRNFIKYLEKSQDEYNYSDRYNTVLKGEGISNKIEIMDFYIENSEWDKADSVLLTIQKDKNMQDDIEFVADFDNYIAFRSSLGVRYIAQLKPSEISYLETLAGKEGRVAGYAQNILCFFYDICYDDEGGQPMAKELRTPSRNKPTLEEILYNITVYPNPANTFASIKWEIYDELNNCQYKIFDLNGHEIESGGIEENVGEQVIDTRSLTNGVYIINIYNDGQMKLSSKLVVNKEK